MIWHVTLIKYLSIYLYASSNKMLFDLSMCFKKLHPISIYKGIRPSSPRTAALLAFSFTPSRY